MTFTAQSPSPSETLRVLLLEDSALDAELISKQLSSAKLAFHLHRVWRREDFVQALEVDHVDVILADHVLPQFDGDSALELARVLSPDTPFIFVSGTLTEELAVQALKRGATDYVVKQRLQRLPDAVQRAVGEAQERRSLRETRLALDESRERLQMIADALPVLIAYVDGEQRYRFNNRAYEDWFGMTPAQLYGTSIRDLTGDATYQQVRPAIERALAGERQSFEGTVAYRNDIVRQVHIDYIPARLGDGDTHGYYALVQDISERKAAETRLRQLNESLESQVQERTVALRRSEARLRAIFETSFQHQGLLSIDGVLLDANSALLESIQAAHGDVCGQPYENTPWFTGTPGMSALIRDWIVRAAAGEAIRQELALQLPSGRRLFDFSMRPLRDDEGTIVALVTEAVETTEQRRAEDALRQAQKMEAVGQLTGGIAHDFNNLLTVIGGNIDMIRGRLARDDNADPRILRGLNNAHLGAERAAALTQRLLAFSRRQPLQPRALDLQAMVGGMSDLLRRSLTETIELQSRALPDLWRVEADPNQLEAAILNLAVNARDAMPDGGRLLIETGNVELDEAATARWPDATPGQYAYVSVSDTGCGMSEDVLSHVFEPFFTTKDVGRGTGLGLSMVYGFIKQSNGHVQLTSTPGRGTTVKLLLPRLLREAITIDKAADNPLRRDDRGEGTILVVEDDDAVRAYTVECLRGLGYQVIESHGGEDALDQLRRQPRPIQLLFTDVVMPGMSGPELATQALRLNPALRVLYTSGYTRNAISHDGRLDVGIALLPKPFTATSLAAKVREVMEGDKQVGP